MLLRNSEINHKYAYYNFLIKSLVLFPGERIERYCLPVNGIPIVIIKNEYWEKRNTYVHSSTYVLRLKSIFLFRFRIQCKLYC